MTETSRPTSRLLVDALLRRTQAAGGFAAVLQRGEDSAGAILIDCRSRNELGEVLEKSTDFDGHMRWRRIVAPDAAPANWRAAYLTRRCATDRDLWLIELDIADAARFADELLAIG